MNTIKVTQTRLHKPSLDTIFGDGRIDGERLVAYGKLVLIDNNPPENGERAVNLHQHREWFKAIVISEIEKIIVGDWVLHWDNMILEFANDQKLADHYNYHRPNDYCKVLVLPEQFSPRQLQAITDGSLINESVVLVDCEEQGYVTESGGQIEWKQIKLNSNGHVTLHTEETSKKLYSLQDVKNAFLTNPKDLVGVIGDRSNETAWNEYVKKNGLKKQTTTTLIEQVNKLADIRILLLNHPDKAMVRAACLHYLGDSLKEIVRQTYVDGYENGYVKGNWNGVIDKIIEEKLR